MKLKHFWSAAAVIWGCIALGHDHETGGGYLEISCPVGPCSMECQAYGRCLVECLTGGICPSEGDTTCPTERRLWTLCLEDNQTTIPPGPFGGIIIGGPVTPPSNECGDDEIGGGSEECQTCGEGESCPHGEISDQPGECWPARFLVASCTRPLESAPWGIRDFLPYHVNVLVEQTDKAGSRLERGFFAIDMQEAVTLAIAWRLNPFRPWMDPVFTPGEVRQDGNLAECVYEPVYAVQRYETVRQRMETYDWTNYHLVEEMSGRYGYGSCITWANSVLAY